MITDKTSIMKYSEHASKVQDQHVVLKDKVITKSDHTHQCLSKTRFFQKGKPRNDGSNVHTNLRPLHSEGMINITDNLKHDLEEEDITLDLQ